MATSRASSARAAVDLAFEELYRGHRADVYRAALRELGNAHDAEDVTQAAFADAYRAVLRGTPRSRRGPGCSRSPRTCAAAASGRHSAVRASSSSRRRRLPARRRAAVRAVPGARRGAAAPPPEQRRVFVLREIVGLSYAEIADEAGSTVGSIQMLLFRAAARCGRQLDPPDRRDPPARSSCRRCRAGWPGSSRAWSSRA
jgi:RNA polymerase sigma-70 factor (ECF subfamily)